MLKRTLKVFWYAVGTLTVTVLVCVVVPRRWQQPTMCSAETVSIYVTGYGYHTGIVVPVRTAAYDWSKEFPCLEGRLFVEIGWGDREFYMGGQVTVGMAFTALFASKSSVVSFIGLGAPPFVTKPLQTKQVCLLVEDYHALVEWVLHSVGRSQDVPKKPQFLREGFWGKHSAFYAANTDSVGVYSLIHNCNVWNADALHAAHVRTPLWAGFPQVLLWMLPE